MGTLLLSPTLMTEAGGEKGGILFLSPTHIKKDGVLFLLSPTLMPEAIRGWGLLPCPQP